MMDFNERVIPGVSANFLYKEALARYVFVLKLLKKNYKVLDLGCGTGYGTSLLAAKAKLVVGVDISREAIDFCNKKYQGWNIKFKIGDIQKLNYPDKYFDIICSFEVIEHLKNHTTFLDETRRVMKPSGSFVMSTPNKIVHSPDGKIQSKYHFREYTYNDLEKLLFKKFKNVNILGQSKSSFAKASLISFMNSQNTRQRLVDKDVFNLRKLVSKATKEKIWKIVGNFLGRKDQDLLKLSDFPITSKNVANCEYFVAICRLQ